MDHTLDQSLTGDLYEVLQLSPTAEPDTVHRVYRLLAQRYHPDNQETGDVARFRQLTDADETLADPVRRAEYDVRRPERLRERAQVLSESVRAETEFESEQLLRLTMLEMLYARRRMEPRLPGIFDIDLEGLIGRPREHLEFSLWYLGQRGFIDRIDGSRLAITADGIDFFEKHATTLRTQRRLKAATIRQV